MSGGHDQSHTHGTAASQQRGRSCTHGPRRPAARAATAAANSVSSPLLNVSAVCAPGAAVLLARPAWLRSLYRPPQERHDRPRQQDRPDRP